MAHQPNKDRTTTPLQGNEVLHGVSGMLNFISALRNTDRYIEMIYLNGFCYQLHLLLKKYFNCEPLINFEKNHVVTKFKSKLFDITGEVKGEYLPMSDKDVEEASRWSFHRTKMIQMCECQFCEEPIMVWQLPLTFSIRNVAF